MDIEPTLLPDISRAVVLTGTGAIRIQGLSLHAWSAKLDCVNEGGLVFEHGKDTSIIVAHHAPCYIEEEQCGHLVNGAQSSDGHHVLRAEMTAVPEWLTTGIGYCVPEYMCKSLRCARCGVLHRRYSTPCECVWNSPSLVLSGVRVIALYIYRLRRDEYSRLLRYKLLHWMFDPVLPTISNFQPHDYTESISQKSTNQEFSESS